METLELELQLWLHTVGACQSGWCIGGGIGIRWTFGGHWRTLVVDQPIYRHSLNIRWTLVVEQTIYRHSVNIATHLVPSNALGAHGNPLCRYFYLKISGSWSPVICSMQPGVCSLVYTMHWCALQSVTFVKILIRMNVRIYSYQQNCTNEYPNIFILIFLTRTNVRISIRIENCTNIRIHSNIQTVFTL